MSPPGDIRAYDVLNGKLVWTFHTVPRPGEYGYDTWPKDAYKYIGGNNNWGEMTVDTKLGIAYIPLGSPTYDFYALDRPGANLFGAHRWWRSMRAPGNAAGISSLCTTIFGIPTPARFRRRSRRSASTDVTVMWSR